MYVPHDEHAYLSTNEPIRKEERNHHITDFDSHT